MNHEDGGPWMQRVKEVMKSDHRGRSYIIKMMKMGGLIMQNHKAHMQHPNNYRAVSYGTDKERNQMI